MEVQHFFDPETFTLSYIVYDGMTRDAVIIDPVLDFDPASGVVSDNHLKFLLEFIRSKNLNVRAILETHAHADHLSSSQLLKQAFPSALLGIGRKITVIQDYFKDYFQIEYLKTDGSQFDLLIDDFQELTFGSLKMKAIPTPGHTPACMSYLFGDSLFTGDALFMPDYGTGRCDFPRGSAKDLYQSVKNNIFSLPDSTKVYVGHDYLPGGREMKYQTTIGESKQHNIQLNEKVSADEYVKFRETRDRTLKAPRLLLPSIQVNIDAGHLPPKDEKKRSYMKLPINLKISKGQL